MVKFAAEDGESCRIRKNKLTIKNGDVKNANFNVEGDGVVFENLSNIGKLTISERVGDGDFTIKDCPNVAEFYVNGGGSESIHIAGTSIAKLAVNKSGVRIAVEIGNAVTKIEKAFILKDCKVESADENTSLAKVIVAETVQTVSFVGKAVVEAIVSTLESATPKIVVEAAIKIKAADEAIKNSIKENNADYNTSAIGTAVISEDEKEEVAAVAEEANKVDADTSLAELETPDSKYEIVVLKSVPTSEGIRIEYQLPGTDDDYNKPNTYPHFWIFIDGLGGIYEGAINKANDYFVYPFVDDGKEYTLRFESCTDNYVNGKVVSSDYIGWKDITVKANGGKGQSVLTSYPTVSVKKNGDFTFAAPKFSNESAVSGWLMRIEFWQGQPWTQKDSEWRKCVADCYIKASEVTSVHNLFELSGYVLDFIQCLPSYNYEDSDGRKWLYRWSFKDNLPTFVLDTSSYQKKDKTPLTLLSQVTERELSYQKENDVYVFAGRYGVVSSANKRRMRIGDKYTIKFSATTPVALTGFWVCFVDGTFSNGWKQYSKGIWKDINIEAGGKIEITETLEINNNAVGAGPEEQAFHITLNLPDALASDDPITLTDVKVEITSPNVTIQKAAE